MSFKTMFKIVSVLVLVGFAWGSFVQPVVYAETNAARKVEQWTCKKWVCSSYNSRGQRTGKWVVYGTVIRVTWRNRYWLKFDVNSNVYAEYYRVRDFSYVGYEGAK